MLKITRLQGEGQCECKGCADKGIWNRNWTSSCYKIDGMDEVYCSKCVDEIKVKYGE